MEKYKNMKNTHITEYHYEAINHIKTIPFIPGISLINVTKSGKV